MPRSANCAWLPERCPVEGEGGSGVWGGSSDNPPDKNDTDDSPDPYYEDAVPAMPGSGEVPSLNGTGYLGPIVNGPGYAKPVLNKTGAFYFRQVGNVTRPYMVAQFDHGVSPEGAGNGSLGANAEIGDVTAAFGRVRALLTLIGFIKGG